MGLVFNPFTGTFDFTGGGGGGSGTVTQINTTSPITGGPITTTGTIGLDVSVDHLFTHSQTITPSAAGQGGLTLSGNTETASTPVLNMTQTWNNAGVTFTALKLNVTDTNSAAASLLLDLELGTAGKFQVSKSGSASLGTTIQSGYELWVESASGTSDLVLAAGHGFNQVGLYCDTGSPSAMGFNNVAAAQTFGYWTTSATGGLSVLSGASFNWSSSGLFAFGAPDLFLYRDAAAILAVRNSTVAQIARIYNTFTSSTNYERVSIDWATTANVAMLGTEKGSGGGTARVLQLNYGGTTTAAISIPITSGAMTFGADPTISGFGAVIYNTGTVAVTGQTADIADTAITINGTGLYSLSYYLLTTTADAAAGTVKLAIKYTDNSGAKEIDSNGVILTATTGFDAGGPITVRTNSGTVTYGTTHTGIYGTSQYALYISLEKLQ